MSRPTKAIIDISALRSNYKLARELAADASTMPVIKANAYGHGIMQIATALDDLAPAYAVACIEEALVLRDQGITKPILLLEGAFTPDELPIASQQNFWVMVTGPEQTEMLAAAQLPKPLTVWVKIDTGMHRLGLTPDEFATCYQQLQTSRNVTGEMVIATHFASADIIESDMTAQQIALFNRLTADLNAPVSLANSAALLHWQASHGQWNRPGIMLYGASPFMHPHPKGDRLRPVMSLESAVIRVHEVAPGESVGYCSIWTADRPSRIATIAIGYGDGYPRGARNGTPVLINEKRAPLVGRVSMDMITVDVTDIPAVAVGDPVVLWGEHLPVNEIAQFADTNSYELLTRMPLRVPKIYVNGE